MAILHEQRQDRDALFCFEEVIGYCFGYVKDIPFAECKQIMRYVKYILDNIYIIGFVLNKLFYHPVK